MGGGKREQWGLYFLEFIGGGWSGVLKGMDGELFVLFWWKAQVEISILGDYELTGMNRFPYPGLELLSMREKGVQCLFMAGVMAGCMMGLQWTYILVHGVRRGTGGERDVKRKD